MASHGWFILNPICQWEGKVEKFIEWLSNKYSVQEWSYNDNFRTLMIEIRRPPTACTIQRLANDWFNKDNMGYDTFQVHVLSSVDGESITHKS